MPLSSMCGHDTCATLLWCCPITLCPDEKFMSNNVSYVSIMLALPKVAPDAMCGASTMCAWTHTHIYIYIYPCMLRPVSTVDTERWLLFECMRCDQHCLQHAPFTHFPRLRICPTQLPQAHRASSITVALALSLVVSGVVRLVESSLPRWKSGEHEAEI